MPAVSRVWDEFTAEFCEPEQTLPYFRGVELGNGLTVEYPRKREGEQA